MRKIKFVSVFVLLALLLSAWPGAVMADEPPPGNPTVVDQGNGDEGNKRNRMDPNYVYTAEELEAIAAKEALVEQHVQRRAGTRSIARKILRVGKWLEPNDWDHRNYCGPGATQVVLDARLPYWDVPDIDTIGEEENIDPNSGVWLSDIKTVLNDRLNTTWYEVNGSGSGSSLYNRITSDIDNDYALVTGCETGLMGGWNGRDVGHIVAVYGYWIWTGSNQYVYYTETAGSVAGYNGSYRQRATRQDFWGYVAGNDTQVW
jgi:hypothetical protein